MKVQELMTRSVEACKPSTDLAAVAMIMWRRDCGIVPVVDNDGRVKGVLTDRDICMAVSTRHRPPEQITAEQVMSGKVFAVHPDDAVHDALRTMGNERVRRLAVTDDGNRLVGLISMNDIVCRTQAHGRPGVEPGVREVIETMKSICRHSVAEAHAEPKRAVEPVPA